MPEVDIRRHKGVPTLHLAGKPVYFAGCWFWPPRHKPWRHGKELGFFRKAGVEIFNWFQAWEEPADSRRGLYDFRVLANHVEQILAEAPDGYFLIKQSTDAPAWWLARFPGERERLRLRPGLAEPRALQSYASVRWRRDAGEYLRQMVAFVREQEWGERVIGIFPCAGGSGEWMTGSTNFSLDYSRHMVKHFRAWLRRKYGTKTRLREAWDSPKIDFETTAVPSWEDFCAGHPFSFRDPRLARAVIDYLECQDDLVADCVIEQCRTILDAAEGAMFTGTYFDKSIESWWPSGYWTLGADQPREIPMIHGSGNGGLARVLESPHVQALASPYSYVYRSLGGDAGYMQLVESAHLHGKLVIMEDDARTFRSPIPDGEFGKPATPQETVTQITRNFGHILSRGTGLWWGYPWHRSAEESGWNNATVMRRVKRLAELGQLSLEVSEQRSSAAEIAVIIDPQSENYLRPDFTLGWSAVVAQRAWGLARMGAPHDTYLLDDLVEHRIGRYKLVIFLNAYALSRKQIGKIHTYLRKNAAMALWVYAAGYAAVGTLSEDNMSEATGIRLRATDAEWPATVTITDYRHPITKELAEHVTFGGVGKPGPIFHAEDRDARALGTVVHVMGKCEPGLVVKAMDGWQSIWSAVPNLPPALLRGIARHAGVHIWSDRDDVLYAGRHWLCVHPLKGGERHFRLPRRTNVYDAISGKLVRASCKQFSARIAGGTCRLYYLGRELCDAGEEVA